MEAWSGKGDTSSVDIGVGTEREVEDSLRSLESLESLESFGSLESLDSLD